MVKYFRLLFVVFVIAASLLKAQNISLSATTDSSEYIVGDYIKYILEIKYNKNIKINMPSVKDSVNNLEFINALDAKRNEVEENIVEQHVFIFSKYDSAQVTIPSYKIFYTIGSDTTKKYLAVNPVTIVVKTLPVNSQEDIRDVKAPVSIPLNWLLIILILFGILLIVTAAYYLYKYYKRKNSGLVSEMPKIIIPPHEIALSELNQLEGKKLWQQGNVKDYHSEITDIIRKYFEGRFNFRALEQPSSEILACLSAMDEGKKIEKISDEFFSNADLVKFAKFQPMPKVNEDMMQQAYKIVNETIPAPAPLENKTSHEGAENVQ